MENKFRCQCGYTFCSGECLVVQEIENELHGKNQRQIILNIIKSSSDFVISFPKGVDWKGGRALLKRARRLMLIAVSIGVVDAPSFCINKVICNAECFGRDECIVNAREWLNSLYSKLEECPLEQLQRIFFYYATLSNVEQELRDVLHANKNTN